MSMSSNKPHEQDPLAPHRGRLLGLAYRMLGSRTDAEDVVQDAYLRFAGAQDVRNAEAFLVTVVTRLCLDRLKSARAQREVYVGPWLPEPVFDAEGLSAETATELADDLSFALLLALDRLSPLERAAFLLHDVFDTPFSEIAAMLDRTEAACRQLATRARRAVRDERPAPAATPDNHARLQQAFGEAVTSGNVARLAELLRADAVALTDGGGRKTAARNPIIGPEKIARFFIGIAAKNAGHDMRIEPAMINGAIGALLYLDGELDSTMSMVISGETNRIAAIYIVRNPDKLRHAPRRAAVECRIRQLEPIRMDSSTSPPNGADI
jgi:RNA polymerase sigma-70 factor (ECF subfamily)